MYKLKIFISAKVDQDKENKFSKMKEAIKKKLESLELFHVYIFESGYGTSKNVIDDFLDEIVDSHICLFLINSAEDIPDGVQLEINEANKQNKPQIYIFNHENTDQETSLEKELKTAKGSRIKIIHTFDKFFDESIESIKSEIVKIYKDYCMGRLIRPEQKEEKGTQKSLTLLETVTEKTFIKGFRITHEYISEFLNTGVFLNEELSSNNLDKFTKSFFEVLIGRKNIVEFNTSLCLEELKKMHSEAVYEVVECRWKAITNYFSGDIENCLENLNIAYENAIKNNVPGWLIQDILIDLRNKYNMKKRNENKTIYSSVYQKRLNEYDEFLTYPVIDRLTIDLYRRLEKKRKDTLYKRPYSITIDNVVSEYARMITSIFVVASYYGSLTHLELIIDKLQEIYFHLVELYSDWEYKLFLLKLTSYLTKSKDMEKIVRTFNDILSTINSKDIEEIINFASSHPDKLTREKNQLLVLQYFGYYLNNDIYEQYERKIITRFNEWIYNPNRIVSIGDFYLKFIKDNINRLKQEEMVKLLTEIFSREIVIYFDKALEILSEIDFDMFTKPTIDKLLSQLINQIYNKKISRFDLLYIVLLKLYRYQSGQEILKIVNKFFPQFEKEMFFTEINKDDINQINEFYSSVITTMTDINEINKNSNTYREYAYNYIKIIKNISTLINRLPIEDSIVISKLLVDIILNEDQSAKAKIDAFQLIVFLINNEIVSSKVYKNFEQILDNADKVLNVKESLFFNYSSTVINFNYFLFKLLFDEEETNYYLFKVLNNKSVEEKLGIIMAIKNFLDGNKSNINPLILHLIVLLSNDEDEQVRANSLLGMFNYLLNHEDKELLIIISRMMDIESPLLKQIILNNIEIIYNKDSSTANYILQKGRLDNHYVVKNNALTAESQFYNKQ